MSNGFSPADMSTAAANGHAEGYQAGYADAVKAVEVGKDAAGQDAVAWQRKYIGATRGGLPVDWHSITKEEFELTKAGKWASKYDVRELYAAPVAASPVVIAVRVEGVGTAHLHLVDGGVDIPALTIQHMAKHLADASTPAAPGIDLAVLHDIADDLSHSAKVDDYEPQQIAFIESIRDRLLALIDASPKGGSDLIAVVREMEHPAVDLLEAPAPDVIRAWARRIKQATSAEVGA